MTTTQTNVAGEQTGLHGSLTATGIAFFVIAAAVRSGY